MATSTPPSPRPAGPAWDDPGLSPEEQDALLAALEAALDGDFSSRLRIRRQGLAGELSRTFNDLMRRNAAVTKELDRLGRRVGRDGRMDERASLGHVQGDWAAQVEAMNLLIEQLAQPITEVSRVLSAVADGDLSRRMSLSVDDRQLRGEFLRIGRSVNTMVDQLSAFADEVTRVAREVGTEGKLGGQARVEGVSGIWKDLTDNVNSMARNLTDQVRNIAEVTTAVAQGDLSRKITVGAQGEILELKTTINRMVDQLSAFADEVTRVAWEVGTEGRLGGQAQVPGVSGTWKDLTDNVNQLAANLTTQVRAIAEVSTAVTRGDLSPRIEVDARGEVAELKDTINQMIANLSATTEKTTAQDWLKTNVAAISTMLQGQRDATEVATKIMARVVPLVEAHSGAFYCSEGRDGDAPQLRLLASYAASDSDRPTERIRFGHGLVGQVAVDRTPILVSQAPPGYLVRSALGQSKPVNVLVLPVLFEDDLMGVVELASLQPFSDVSRQLLDELVETLGVVLHTIESTVRTEELLEQSQSLTQELQAQSEELQAQQEELQQTNEELEEKAELLEAQKRAIEATNAEIVNARAQVEERAEQLARASRYKSEFLANMSHELRTPLNSMLILSRLLADEDEGLTEEQREFAETIHRSGNDLLHLINDILDLSKIEAGRMDVSPDEVTITDIVEPVHRSLEQVAAGKGLPLRVEVAESAESQIYTDIRRVQQILKNLLSNAIKFTEEGEVRLEVRGDVPPDDVPERLRGVPLVAFRVADTGIGIGDELRQVIFEAFQQGDGSQSRRHGGTGLGLSISRELAALLGGTLTLDSVPGRGSVFTLFLPTTYVPQQERIDADGGSPDGSPDAFPDADPDVMVAVDAEPGKAPAEPTAEPGSNGQAPGRGPADGAMSPSRVVADDRDVLRPGDPCMLAMVGDIEAGQRVVRLAHDLDHRILVALDRSAGFSLAAGFKPRAILLHGESPSETLATLTYLKRRRETRHVPVAMAAAAELRQDALRTGAALTFPSQPDDAALREVITKVMALGLETDRRVLVMEGDAASREAVAALLQSTPDVEVVAVATPDEARNVLQMGDVDLLVLNLHLPDRGGIDLLEQLRSADEFRSMPIIIYTGRDLSRHDEKALRKYAESILVKTVGSSARLLDEVLLHLHRTPAGLHEDAQQLLEDLYTADQVLHDRRVLVVDDDERNVLALTRVLEANGMTVDTAENGAQALDRLDAEDRDYDLVLMDIMMPEMDGHEATRRIREHPRHRHLPVITLTAKAMREDRRESLAAGASDFITKPVDVDQLLSLLRVWLYR